MRILVISDVHSNLSALEAVLQDSKNYGPYDIKLFGGDVVGYGPQPNECISLILAEDFEPIRGNHDRGVLDGRVEIFNKHAQDAARYNASILTLESRLFLTTLSGEPIVGEGYSIVHGSFEKFHRIWTHPFEDIYIHDELDAVVALKSIILDDKYKGVKIGMVNHTHVQIYVHSIWDGPNNRPFTVDYIDNVRTITQQCEESANSRVLLLANPGSVGQPRGGDPRAAYAVITIEESDVRVDYHRVNYNIAHTQQLMREAQVKVVAAGLSTEQGFSDALINRLAIGR